MFNELLNKLYQIDCLLGLKQLPSESINTIITSPPYNKTFFNGGKRPENKGNSIWKGYTIEYDIAADNMPLEDYEEWLSSVLKECYRVLAPGGSIFFNHKPIRYQNKIYHPMNIILKSGLDVYQEIVWNRKNSPNIRKDVLLPCTERIYWITKGKPKFYKERLPEEYRSEVWDIIAKKSKHPAPFPEELVYNCMISTTDENDVVLDPFLGSGTTPFVAKQYGRRYIGFEISDEYIKMSNERLEQINQYICIMKKQKVERKRDDNIYVKMDNGRYRPYGQRCDENYLYDGIWYVRHSEHSKSITNVDHYMEGLFRVGDRPQKIDVPRLCAMQDYVDYILSSDKFAEFEKKGYYSWVELTSAFVALILDMNKQYQKKSKKPNDQIDEAPF